MRERVSQQEIDSYQKNGFVVINDLLDAAELKAWRETIFKAVEDRAGVKIPGTTVKTGEDDGINADAGYYGKVFDQIINLWQTDAGVKKLILDERIGRMAADLAGVDGIRPWHDQALFKRPWANPTAWHVDSPFWSFHSRDALSIWIALDDATVENGSLFFVPGSHKVTTFENYGIGKNMDFIFDHYPALKSVNPFSAPLKAGSCTFHNGLCIHGAGPNMTAYPRRAMTCAFMPDGSTYNGIKNILPDEYVNQLTIGDVLANEQQNPLIYHRTGKRSI
jgi:ectoine hydroxylase-related dioxygenase (phytanoyl-CoA dioxygenase family)